LVEGEYTFAFFFESNLDLEFYLDGELKEYGEIVKVRDALDRTFVTVRLKLPEKLDRPGINILRIGGAEVADKETVGVGFSYDAGAIIKVRVPYPGKYAEGRLSISDANYGSEVPYELELNSLGIESIITTPRFEIYNSEGIKEIVNLEPQNIESGATYNYKGKLSSTSYPPGQYNLTAIIDYGGINQLKISEGFRIGELRVDVTNYTKEIEKNKINRFEIHVESYWNDPIDALYAELQFPTNPSMNSKTTTIDMKPWQKTFLTTYVDASSVKDKTIDGKVILYYADKTTTQDIKVTIKHPISMVVIIAIVVAVVFIIVIVFLIILRSLKKSNQNKKKE